MSHAAWKLIVLPCLDSEEMAHARKRELNLRREVATELGRTAVEAAKTGSYVNAHGETVDWSALVSHACSAKVSIAPEAPLPAPTNEPCPETRIQVTNETTLQAARRLIEQGR